MIATALVALASSTTLLGLALVLTGKLRLAGLVQYLPLPVVGGYLAYIGLYCFEAGLSLMSGTEVTSVAQMVSLAGGAGILPCLPGVACGVGIILALQRWHHFLVLPSLLLSIPVLFYAAAFAAGLDLPALRAAGYLSEAEQPASCLETWSSFRPSLVHWDVLPSLLPTWLAMYTVVAFSSSLDVAAIQMDMGKQLDFNHELITVGLSNAASGLCGGFTGSYIFSTTIFTYRTGTRLRLCGAVVIAAELLLFASPVTVGAYVPKLFFGAVLTFIAADLLVDWLWAARHKVHPTEYAIILLTFGAINCFGLEVGMCGGVLIAMCHFIIDYASAPVVRRIDVRSTVLRSFAHSRALAGEQTRLISLRCRGYIFFGSTLRIMEDVLSAVSVPPHLEPTLGRPPSKQRPSAQPAPPTRFVLFDFAAVTGLDATAARACFLNLTRTLAPLGIEVVFGGLPAGGRIAKLLTGHGILTDSPSLASARRVPAADEIDPRSTRDRPEIDTRSARDPPRDWPTARRAAFPPSTRRSSTARRSCSRRCRAAEQPLSSATALILPEPACPSLGDAQAAHRHARVRLVPLRRARRHTVRARLGAPGRPRRRAWRGGRGGGGRRQRGQLAGEVCPARAGAARRLARRCRAVSGASSWRAGCEQAPLVDSYHAGMLDGLAPYFEEESRGQRAGAGHVQDVSELCLRHVP